MSSFLYGDITHKRLDAASGTSIQSSPPATKTYIDAITALVPAEVLAIQGVIATLTVETGDDGSSKITYPMAVQWSFFALLAASVAFFFLGLKRRPERLDLVRMLIPPVAFAGWTLVQSSTAFDLWFPNFSGVPELVAAIILAGLLGALAKKLGDKADQAAPA